jgi:CDP-paratose 2-epimerase
MLEAIALFQKATGKELTYSVSPQTRMGDHIWWISDVSKFQTHYGHWKYEYDLDRIVGEIVEAMIDRYKQARAAGRTP